MAKRKREKLKNTISKIKPYPPFFCQKYSLLLLHFEDDKLHKIDHARLRCKSWSCPTCAPLNAVAAYFKIREVALLNKLSYFLTLTLDPEKIPDTYFENGLNKTHRYITYLFNRLLNKLRKAHKDLRYVWVIQFHNTGNAHLHILLNKRPNIEFVREEWIRIGGGTQMRVEKVISMDRVTSYVVSYVAKGLKEISSGNIGFFHYEKRYMISHSCIKPKNTFSNLANNPELLQKLRSVINQAFVNGDGTIYPKET